MQKLIIYNKTGNPSESFELDNGVSVHFGLGLVVFKSRGETFSFEISDLKSFDVVIDKE